MSEPKRYEVVGDEGANQRAVVRVLTPRGHFPIGAGAYVLVCGVPRKLWSLSLPDQGAGLLEAYEYELQARFREALGFELADVHSITGRVKPAEALEIAGQFDPDGCHWPAGAAARVRWPLTGETETIDLPDWQFTLYEGDRLYRANGDLVLSL